MNQLDLMVDDALTSCNIETLLRAERQVRREAQQVSSDISKLYERSKALSVMEHRLESHRLKLEREAFEARRSSTLRKPKQAHSQVHIQALLDSMSEEELTSLLTILEGRC